jgi:hypothetical protein
MIEALGVFMFGFAAHQTDRAIRHIDGDFNLLVRYVIGVCGVIASATLIIYKINRAALKDALLSNLLAAGLFGAGVAVARLYAAIMERWNT